MEGAQLPFEQGLIRGLQMYSKRLLVFSLFSVGGAGLGGSVVLVGYGLTQLSRPSYSPSPQGGFPWMPVLTLAYSVGQFVTSIILLRTWNEEMPQKPFRSTLSLLTVYGVGNGLLAVQQFFDPELGILGVVTSGIAGVIAVSNILLLAHFWKVAITRKLFRNTKL